MNRFGSRLREERKRLGMTQEQLAPSAGVTSKTQGNYESGLRSPDEALLLQAYRSLGQSGKTAALGAVVGIGQAFSGITQNFHSSVDQVAGRDIVNQKNQITVLGGNTSMNGFKRLPGATLCVSALALLPTGAQAEEWHQGGTLHKSNLVQWNKAGVVVRKGVTAKPTFLCTDSNAGPSKVTAALGMGVVLMDQEAFGWMLKTGGVPV